MKQGLLFERPLELPQPLSIGQRRYLGNKQQLLGFIEDILARQCGRFTSFGDFFAGTGVVSSYFNNSQRRIYSNELLYSNYVCINAFLGDEYLDVATYNQFIHQLWEDSLSVDENYPENYFSLHFGGKYFSRVDACKIGSIRESIDSLRCCGRLRDALIASLLYSVDRIAHTCGHYDAFRQGVEEKSIFRLFPLALHEGKDNHGNRIMNGFAQDVMSLPCDVVYLDPPYNSRQYCDAYHLLENLAQWKKPPVSGKAAKFDRSGLKSAFNLKGAYEAMKTLIEHLQCRCIIISYSNMEGKGHTRSANRLSAEELNSILSLRGKVVSFEQSFRPFSTGKALVEDHREILYLCSVRD